MDVKAASGVAAVVLAGGRGKRMGILCDARPKPCLPFGGGHRVIDFVLSNCANSQIGHVGVAVDYQRVEMEPYLQVWAAAARKEVCIGVLAPRRGSYSGTADAVYRNLDYLRSCGANTVLVLAGDHVYNMDYRKMLESHRQSGAEVTVATATVPLEQARRFGVVEADPAGRIVNFVEKPMYPQSDQVSMGIYAFNREALCEKLREDATRSGSSHDFGYSIIPEMVRRNRAYAYRFGDYWRDIGTIESYHQANMEFARKATPASGDAQWPILAGTTTVTDVRVTGGGRIDGSLVGPGCVIRGRIENSVLSAGVIVEEQAVVKDSVVMAHVVVGRRTVVDRCILDEGVRVGEFCYVGFGQPGRNGGDVTVLGRWASVPSFTAIDRGRTVQPWVVGERFSSMRATSGAVLSPVHRLAPAHRA